MFAKKKNLFSFLIMQTLVISLLTFISSFENEATALGACNSLAEASERVLRHFPNKERNMRDAHVVDALIGVSGRDKVSALIPSLLFIRIFLIARRFFFFFSFLFFVLYHVSK